MERSSGLAMLLMTALAVATPSGCRGEESYWMKGQQGGFASFYLIGGNYDFEIFARRPHTYASDPASRSCFFSGVFQRVSPNPESVRVGTNIPIGTIVPYRVSKIISMPAGLYVLKLGSMTTCKWDFGLSSTPDNPAGIGPVAMGRPADNHQRILDTAALGEKVQFYAQCRTAKNEHMPASGTAELAHDGTVFLSAPLNVAKDTNLGDTFFIEIAFAPEHEKYAGKNTATFKVKIGGDEFTSTGEFTLTR